MSYQRIGYDLEYFKTGKSKSYVFAHVEGFVQDYNDKYDDTKSLLDLIGRFIECETRDKRYAKKIVRVLAKKLNLEKELR